MHQGPVQVLSPLVNWQSPIDQNEERSLVSNKKLPSHIKPESPALDSEIAIENKINIVTTSIDDSESSSSDEDFLPSRFTHNISKQYVISLKTNYKVTTEKLKADSENGFLRLKMAQVALLLSEVFCHYLAEVQEAEIIDEEKEILYSDKQNDFLEQAKEECKDAKDINPLDPNVYYTESMIMEFEGVNCQEIEHVEKYLQLLKLALALDPTKADIQKTLDKAVLFLQKRWAELKSDNTISSEVYSNWLQKLNLITSGNPLKDLFQSNPELFKLSTDITHAAFFKRNPELKSIQAFLSVYPQAGIIPVTAISSEAIHSAVAREENNPLATKLFFVHPAGSNVIRPDVADAIKDSIVKYANKNKQLKVYLGNKDDLALVRSSFKLDSNLPKKFDTLTTEIREIERFKIPIYTLSIL